MKKALILLVAAMTVGMWISSPAGAQTSWWDKGVDILKTLNQESAETPAADNSFADIAEAFKQALRMGTENVVSRLGAVDGFNADPAVHIPLPRELVTVKTVLSKIGMSGLADDLELKLNRAAEAATPIAKDLFLQAIGNMTFDDVKAIYQGPTDSATKYFQSKMSPPLEEKMQPIVDDVLSQVGAIQAYDALMGQYSSLPFVPDVRANLTGHVIEKGMAGIFGYLAKEEASIRQDPARQTTALLKKVFGVK
ncbi:MAG: DUF4197 domain-containing protein [Desulfobacterales bacterium]|nr:DUF4197 domain-containing protein [Desulfobacterales bacterium]